MLYVNNILFIYMELWYSTIYTSLMIACAIAFFISFVTNGTVSFGATLSGYSLLIISVSMILILLFNSILNFTSNTSLFQTVMIVLSTTGPFLLMLGVIGFLMYLQIFYMQAITNQQVSPSYYGFSNITITLLLLQIYIVYQNINSEKFITTNRISRITSSLLYLFGTLTFMCSYILYTILKYFRTDG